MPDAFLNVRCEVIDLSPHLTAWCAGYETGEWRARQLSLHLIEWLPEFALRYSEWRDLGAHNAVALLAKAAASIYNSPNYKRRGEFGEILLHLMIRQHFKSVPVIAKYYYKDSRNDTVKGFDAVHVVGKPGDWELWLGEVKFYSDIADAIRDVVKELKEHSERDYLRSEFTAITNKLDDELPEAVEIRRLLHKNISLDRIFERICIPVLLTYDSPTIGAHSEITAEYEAAFAKEVSLHRDDFAAKSLPTNVGIRLFLLPVHNKARLVELMDEALKTCQRALTA